MMEFPKTRWTCGWLVAAALLTVLLPAESPAQNFNFFIGLNGGIANDNPPMESYSNHYFPPNYSTNGWPGLYGATAGVLLKDKFEIRVEAIRSQFHFNTESTTPYPASLSKSSSVTDGHVTQFPLMVGYRITDGRARAFVGGGLTIGRSIKGSTTAQLTTYNPLPTPTETTVVQTFDFNPDQGKSPVAFNGSMGFEFRKRWISIRPELRLSFWYGYRYDDSSITLFEPVQIQFLVGVRLHPFAAH